MINTFSSPKFDEAGVISHEIGLLQMSQQRCILEQVLPNVTTASFIAQFIFENVVH